MYFDNNLPTGFFPWCPFLGKGWLENTISIWPFWILKSAEILPLSGPAKRLRGRHIKTFNWRIMIAYRLPGRNDASRFNKCYLYRNFFDDRQTDRDIAVLEILNDRNKARGAVSFARGMGYHPSP